jgi:cytochrome c biogenesis protein CcmG, thiol:disulfide interchange protein DsbE
VPCVIEHPQLMRLAKDGVPVLGVAYKDKPADALGFLKKHGTPYAKLAADLPGRVAIDWGLYGVPETYLIDRQGIIRWRWAGPLTEDTLTQELLPLLRRTA